MSSSLIKAFTLGAALGMVFAVAPSCGTAAGSCDASSCGNGCCKNGLCLAGYSLTTCGKAGNACNACSSGQSCTGGVCVANSGAGGGAGGCSNCEGCCFRSVCFTGKATDACGVSGAACNTCQTGLVCPNGACITPPAEVDAGTAITDAGRVTDAGSTRDSGMAATDGGSRSSDGGIGSNAPCSNAAGNDCGSGEACYVTGQTDGGFETRCLTQGTSNTGGTCVYVNDCSAGNICLNGNPSRCYKLCSNVGGTCSGGQTCANLGTQGLGYCTN